MSRDELDDHYNQLHVLIEELWGVAQQQEEHGLRGETEGVEGCRQTTARALERIDQHLSYFRNLCKGDA